MQGTLKVVLYNERLAKRMRTFNSYYFDTWEVAK